MPRSVATIKVLCGRRWAAAISWLVEPTASARSITAVGDSGCTSTAASGYRAFMSSSCLALNSSWTMQAPSHSSMSAPVLFWI
ncbi:hypothetical protein D3C84_820990 [compost metagenome]